MSFEVGKYYKHTTGTMIHVLTEVETMTYGKCLVAEETTNQNLVPLGIGESFTENWIEITKEEFVNYYIRG